MAEYIKKNDIVLNYRGLAKINPYDFAGIAKYFKDQINEIPTVDAASVVHAHWIYHPDDLFPDESTQECSSCHEEEYITLCNEKYCPNCGAKMDGTERS